MLHPTQAIVLHYLRYRESSIIVRCYTQSFGAQSYVVNGVRSARGNAKIGYYQPLSLLDLMVYHRPQADLQRISQVQFHDPTLTPSPSIKKTTIRLFLSEVFSKVLKEEEANRDKFDFLSTSIQAFEYAEAHTENFHLQCLLGLAKRLGFGSTSASEIYQQVHRFGAGAGAPQEEVSALQQLIDTPYFTDLGIPYGTRVRLLDTILLYYKLHIDGFGTLRSVEVLHAIFQ